MDGFSRLSPASLKGIRSLFKRGDFLVTLPGESSSVDSHHGGVPPFSSVPAAVATSQCQDLQVTTNVASKAEAKMGVIDES